MEHLLPLYAGMDALQMVEIAKDECNDMLTGINKTLKYSKLLLICLLSLILFSCSHVYSTKSRIMEPDSLPTKLQADKPMKSYNYD